MNSFKRIKLSEKATKKLRMFKMRTGITPNIACRISLAFSLSQKNVPNINFYKDDSGQIIDRYTFLGEYEDLILSIFILWCHDNNVDEQDQFSYFMAHINRGAESISNRVKHISDIDKLLGDINEYSDLS